MGTRDNISERKLWTIPLMDIEAQELPIRNRKEAIQLLKDLLTPN